MENIEKNEQRVYIKSHVASNQRPIDIHADLVKIHVDKAYTYNTAATWAARFNSGQSSTEDNPRSGCPITATCKPCGRLSKRRSIYFYKGS